MTDEEIVKALENCGGVGECQKCTLNDLGEGISICIPKLTQSAVELINRQKADVERYKGVIKILEKDVKDAKAEAIKDFAERLRKRIGFSEKPNVVIQGHIRNLVKEMVGEPTKIEHDSLCETETYKGRVKS